MWRLVLKTARIDKLGILRLQHKTTKNFSNCQVCVKYFLNGRLKLNTILLGEKMYTHFKSNHKCHTDPMGLEKSSIKTQSWVQQSSFGVFTALKPFTAYNVYMSTSFMFF